jgi:hypothetical protein
LILADVFEVEFVEKPVFAVLEDIPQFMLGAGNCLLWLLEDLHTRLLSSLIEMK